MLQICVPEIAYLKASLLMKIEIQQISHMLPINNDSICSWLL